MELYLDDKLTDKQRQRVTEYVVLESDEKLVAVLDTTLMGSLKGGIAVTNRRVVVYDREVTTSLQPQDFTAICITPDETGRFNHEVIIENTIKRIHQIAQISQDQLHVFQELVRTLVGPTVPFVSGRTAAADPVVRNISRARTGMSFTTTPSIEGRPAVEYLGIVSGEAVVGVNLIDIAGVTGGRSRTMGIELADAREQAFQMVENAAVRVGANAVVGIDVDYQEIGRLMLVSVNGTAVKLQELSAPYRG